MAKFAKEGFEIRNATNGMEVPNVLKDYTPDIILLDLIMPKKDGFETLKDIKSNPQWKDIPVIVTSNLGQKEDIDRVKALGAADFIIKSNNSIQEIIDKISKMIG